MAGLLGKALAGAAAGGQEVAKVGMQDYLMRERDALELKRQERLMSFQTAQQERGFGHTEKLAKERQDFDATQHGLDRGLRQEQLDESIRTGEATREHLANQDAVAKRQIKLAESNKDLPASDKALLGIYTHQLAGLDALGTKIESDAMMDDPAKDRARKTIASQRSAVHKSVFDLLGKQAPGGGATSGVDWSKFGVGGAKPEEAPRATAGPRPQQVLGPGERMIAGMSEAALRQAAEKNDDIGTAAKARLSKIEKERAESAEESARFPYPR